MPALSPDCQRWSRVQERLAALGYHVLVLGGRLDPGALTFSGAAGSRKLALAPVPGLSDEAKKTLAGAVDAVNRDAEALQVLAERHSGAEQLCKRSGGCRPTTYQFETKPLKGATPEDEIFQWFVAGEKYPTVSEWRVYEAIYAQRPELCPVLQSMHVDSRASGVAQIDGMFTKMPPQETYRSHLNPCTCFLSGHVGRGSRPNCTDC